VSEVKQNIMVQKGVEQEAVYFMEARKEKGAGGKKHLSRACP
jgi:hypothetical protein